MCGDIMVQICMCETFFLNGKMRVLKYLFRLMYVSIEGVG